MHQGKFDILSVMRSLYKDITEQGMETQSTSKFSRIVLGGRNQFWPPYVCKIFDCLTWFHLKYLH